ncbi:MAG: hypothetical protein JSW73_00215 [Candidatus Woesearchaeota archaeon]|nr:MAG: hypothetical protein JSW73_00215 [Candidatus Woesearchaeota archaeon]
MDTKKLVISMMIGIFFISTILSSGCSLWGEKEDETPSEPKYGEFYIEGTDGVVISFMRNRPPSELYKNVPFQIAVKLENRGEHTIRGINSLVKVFISGIYPFSYGFSEDEKSPEGEYLEGIRRFNNSVLPGGIAEVVFDGTGYNGYIKEGGRWEQPLKVSVCYPYETNVASKVCLKDDIYKDTVGSTPCKITGSKYVETSASPIKVTKVYEEPIGTDTVAFKIDIENVGGRYPYIGEIDECAGLDEKNQNEIILASMKCGDLGLKCTSGCALDSGGLIKLYDNKAIIIIEGDISNANVPAAESEEMLTLRFYYNYYDDVSKTIAVLG